MWKIKNIKAVNIVSFKDLDLEVEQGVATLIFGQNNDSDGQNANGSGKSAIMEAISIALTGDSLRKVQTDEIISDWADDGSVGMKLCNDYDGRMLIIERRLHRKGSQEVSCSMYDANGSEIMKDLTVQPSVQHYDKFILSELGLERDELFNSYILCKNKYKSFLDASDKDKKELINRFTNGRIVDESIEALEVDIESAKAVVSEKELAVSKLNGSIEAVNSQMEEAERKRIDDQEKLAAKIGECDDYIAKCRSEIRDLNDRIDKQNKKLDAIDKVGDEIEALERSESNVGECYQTIRKWYGIYGLGELADYDGKFKDLSDELDSSLKQRIALKDKLAHAEEAVRKIQKGCDNTLEEYTKVSEKVKEDGRKDREELERIDGVLADINKEIVETERSISQENKKIEDLGEELVELSNILHGAVECPKCKYKFIISSEKTVDEISKDYDRAKAAREESRARVESYKAGIGKREEDIQKYRNERAEIGKRNENRSWSVSNIRQALDMARKNLSEAKLKVSSIKSDEILNQTNTDRLKKEIQSLRQVLFDDVLNNIDSTMDAGENSVSLDMERVSFLEGQIKSHQDLIKRLNEKPEDITQHLRESLSRYKSELKRATGEYEEALSAYNTLAVQKEHFQMFKSHLANTKIDAIAQMTNLFLQEIGSDIRIELEGFRLLKSGKMREKITTKILRDGEEIGSFNKMSAGERTRVYLANILAMQKLSNGGCQDGKGLDFLALDEILEAVDYEGLMNSCQALNTLKVTSLVITQNSVQESYKNTIIVCKTNGISLIK